MAGDALHVVPLFGDSSQYGTWPVVSVTEFTKKVPGRPAARRIGHRLPPYPAFPRTASTQRISIEIEAAKNVIGLRVFLSMADDSATPLWRILITIEP
jgi:hypothetical protein